MKRYERLEDLPRSLREELPERAQRLYLAKHRETWTRCHMGGVTGEQELARLAHDAGMLAVEGEFEKDQQGRWREAPVAASIDPDKLEGRAPDHD